MKVFTRAEFMKLPAGTLYARWQPNMFGDLCIHGGEYGPDFLCQEVLCLTKEGDERDWDGAFDRLNEGLHVGLEDDCYGREGMFDPAFRYAVLDHADLKLLQKTIAAALLNPDTGETP